ncbi:MAG: ferrochelatase, partial [Eggerthellaceae bacterium]|nr:ferrochelatase [Eggerthellaceae bacterium]
MIGILMINTGTADEPTEEAVRAYLREFLSDKHLVDAPAFIWRPILEWVILRKRPKYSLPRYIDYWTPEGSP